MFFKLETLFFIGWSCQFKNMHYYVCDIIQKHFSINYNHSKIPHFPVHTKRTRTSPARFSLTRRECLPEKVTTAGFSLPLRLSGMSLHHHLLLPGSCLLLILFILLQLDQHLLHNSLCQRLGH